eukprot:493794-Ditylum_brightwellii.AAC.1
MLDGWTKSRRDTLDHEQKDIKRKKSADASTPWTTSCFHTPAHLRLNRVDKETGVIPRWVFVIIISNLLDQDTYLFATQQKNLLVKEADNLHHMMKEQGTNANNMEKTKKL